MLRDAADQVAEPRQRHADVLEQQRALGLDRRDREAAGGDERLALVGVVGGEHLGRAVLGEHRGDHLGVLGRRRGRVRRTGDQHRGGVAVQPHLQLVLDGVDGDARP